VKIGSVVVEIFKGKEAHCLRQYILYTSVTGVTAPKFTIFVHDVDGSFALFT